VPDLHGWITQQIDETERLARRAAELCGCHPPKPSWSFRDGDEPTDGRILIVGEPHPSLKRKIGRRWNGSHEGLFMAEHIVRHDPEAVLRRCEADRKALALHRPEPGQHPDFCGYDKHEMPCPGLRLLAEAYGWKEQP
jgi:hypothetical protein